MASGHNAAAVMMSSSPVSGSVRWPVTRPPNSSTSQMTAPAMIAAWAPSTMKRPRATVVAAAPDKAAVTIAAWPPRWSA
jgi:hypothetical protein